MDETKLVKNELFYLCYVDCYGKKKNYIYMETKFFISENFFTFLKQISMYDSNKC